jgi:Putative MetA-pathway of phenol degradation
MAYNAPFYAAKKTGESDALRRRLCNCSSTADTDIFEERHDVTTTLFILAISVFAVILPARAGAMDMATISTSRPMFTDTPTTVPMGSYQVESGATYTHNSDDTRSWTLPELLLRVGILPTTEVRLTVPNYLHMRAEDGRTLVDNFGDMSVGLSQHFALPGNVDLAVIAIVNIPTGAENVSSNGVDPQLRVVWGKRVTSQLSLGGQLDSRWNTDARAAADGIFNPTLVGHYSWTSQFTSFVEYSAFIPTTGKTSQFIQSGLMFMPTKRQQLDGGWPPA